MRRLSSKGSVDSILARYLARSISVDLDIVSAVECSGGRKSEDHYESTTITHRYVDSDLAMYEKAFARLEAPSTKLRQFRAPDSLTLSCKSCNYAQLAWALNAQRQRGGHRRFHRTGA
jgi:hypothetical protein